MKSETISALLIAKGLWRKAFELSYSNEQIQASTGLVILQDAVELFFLACLFERECNLKDAGFEKIISKLDEIGVSVPEIAKIKAMNKERVIVKHFGQLGNPGTIRGYFEAAKISINVVLKQVVFKTIDEIVGAEQIEDKAIQSLFIEAEQNVSSQKYFSALVSIRKAIFLAFEKEYCIDAFQDMKDGDYVSMLTRMFSGGLKAPYHTKNREWIEKNVKDPFDFIQIDYEKMKMDLLEIGVETIDYENISQLTPRVYFSKSKDDWFSEGTVLHLLNDQEDENARYCLETAMMMVLKKESFHRARKNLSHVRSDKLFAKAPKGTVVYSKATTSSESVCQLDEETQFVLCSILIGLDFTNYWVKIHSILNRDKPWISGNVLKSLVEIIECE